jgi:hypothetical protein
MKKMLIYALITLSVSYVNAQVCSKESSNSCIDSHVNAVCNQVVVLKTCQAISSPDKDTGEVECVCREIKF